MASARTAFISLAEKIVTAKFPKGPADTDFQESKKGTVFVPVFDIGGFMPEKVSTVTIAGKSYDVSMKVQISMKRTGSGPSVTKGDVDIK